MANSILNEGVSYDEANDSFMFNFEHDDEHDIVKLVSDGPYKIEEYYPCTYFGYVFEDGIDGKVKKEFINLIKYPDSNIQALDLRRFVSRAVNSLDKKISLPKYDVIVHPQSSSKLNNLMIDEIYTKSLSTKYSVFELIKDLPSKMEFNYDGYIDTMKKKPGMTKQNIDASVKTIEKMMNDLRSLEYVKLGTYVKPKYRPYMKNFYRFKDDEAKKTFESLQGNNVLIVDDVSTSRATLHYVLNTIRLVNDTCNIAMFCLLWKQSCCKMISLR